MNIIHISMYNSNSAGDKELIANLYADRHLIQQPPQVSYVTLGKMTLQSKPHPENKSDDTIYLLG